MAHQGKLLKRKVDLHEKSATEIAGLISLSRNQLYQLYKKENISEKHVNKLQKQTIQAMECN